MTMNQKVHPALKKRNDKDSSFQPSPRRLSKSLQEHPQSRIDPEVSIQRSYDSKYSHGSEYSHHSIHSHGSSSEGNLAGVDHVLLLLQKKRSLVMDAEEDDVYGNYGRKYLPSDDPTCDSDTIKTKNTRSSHEQRWKNKYSNDSTEKMFEKSDPSLFERSEASLFQQADQSLSSSRGSETREIKRQSSSMEEGSELKSSGKPQRRSSMKLKEKVHKRRSSITNTIDKVVRRRSSLTYEETETNNEENIHQLKSEVETLQFHRGDSTSGISAIEDSNSVVHISNGEKGTSSDSNARKNRRKSITGGNSGIMGMKSRRRSSVCGKGGVIGVRRSSMCIEGAAGSRRGSNDGNHSGSRRSSSNSNGGGSSRRGSMSGKNGGGSSRKGSRSHSIVPRKSRRSSQGDLDEQTKKASRQIVLNDLNQSDPSLFTSRMTSVESKEEDKEKESSKDKSRRRHHSKSLSQVDVPQSKREGRKKSGSQDLSQSDTSLLSTSGYETKSTSSSGSGESEELVVKKLPLEQDVHQVTALVSPLPSPKGSKSFIEEHVSHKSPRGSKSFIEEPISHKSPKGSKSFIEEPVSHKKSSKSSGRPSKSRRSSMDLAAGTKSRRSSMSGNRPSGHFRRSSMEHAKQLNSEVMGLQIQREDVGFVSNAAAKQPVQRSRRSSVDMGASSKPRKSSIGHGREMRKNSMEEMERPMKASEEVDMLLSQISSLKFNHKESPEKKPESNVSDSKEKNGGNSKPSSPPPPPPPPPREVKVRPVNRTRSQEYQPTQAPETTTPKTQTTERPKRVRSGRSRRHSVDCSPPSRDLVVLKNRQKNDFNASESQLQIVPHTKNDSTELPQDIIPFTPTPTYLERTNNNRGVEDFSQSDRGLTYISYNDETQTDTERPAMGRQGSFHSVDDSRKITINVSRGTNVRQVAPNSPGTKFGSGKPSISKKNIKRRLSILRGKGSAKASTAENEDFNESMASFASETKTSSPENVEFTSLRNRFHRKNSKSKVVFNMPFTDNMGDSGLYSGDVNEDCRPHGKGKMKYENGIFYEGMWQDGSQDTKALTQRERILNGFTSWKGQGKDPKNGGNGISTVYGMDWVDLSGMSGKYTGCVDSDNVPNGDGMMRYDFGLVAEGEWIKGVLNNGVTSGQPQVANSGSTVVGGSVMGGGAMSIASGGMSMASHGMVPAMHSVNYGASYPQNMMMANQYCMPMMYQPVVGNMGGYAGAQCAMVPSSAGPEENHSDGRPNLYNC